ncbi:MAG: coenzyme F420-0:L-glutamate ligase [Actinobacteria bacterium]|nr:coenzyme F420-0:L-glutamate ligase [Actinomycetota bacterium]
MAEMRYKMNNQSEPTSSSTTTGTAGLSILPVTGVGEVTPGCDLAGLIVEHCKLDDYDVLVVTQKVVSKAEGRVVQIDATDPDAKRKLVESEARRILRRRGDLLITETHHGFVCASSGVDLSNVEEGYAVLLPVDPDRSARRIRDRINAINGRRIGVIISDTFGRPWRTGLTDVAIGCAGVAAIVDLKGTADANGRILNATEVCVADELASAAELVMGKSSAIPAAIVRGLPHTVFRDSSIKEEVIRHPSLDLFR